MADFKAAMPYMLVGAGGYVFDPQDTGGETYCDISRVFWPKWAGWPIVDRSKPLKKGQVINSPELQSLLNIFYKATFWDKIKGDFINDQHVAVYLYDFYVHKQYDAVKALQMALGLDPDGGVGHDTLTAINCFEGDLLQVLHNARIGYYKEHGGSYTNGFINRANNLYSKLKNE